jgi:hypothetical protein
MASQSLSREPSLGLRRIERGGKIAEGAISLGQLREQFNGRSDRIDILARARQPAKGSACRVEQRLGGLRPDLASLEMAIDDLDVARSASPGC